MPATFTGLREFQAAVALHIVAAAAVTELAVRAAAQQVERDTVDLLMLREHAHGTPTPSAPGEPPAMISGALKASVHVEPGTTNGAYFEARVGPTAPYARIQELGGVAGRGAQLPARPYLRPALEGAREKVHAIFVAHWAALGRGIR